MEILGKWSRTEKTLIIGANLIQKVARPDKSDHRESKNVQTRKEMQMWGERVKESLRKTKGGNGEKKVFYEGRCEHGWGWGMVQEGGEGCNYLKWKINGQAVMQNVNTLLRHVEVEKGITFYSPHICNTKA